MQILGSHYTFSAINCLTPTEIDKEWTVVERKVGQFGRKRNEIFKSYDEKYGSGAWRVAWQVEDDNCVPFEETIKYYDEAYLKFLDKHCDLLFYLIYEASNVYDNDPIEDPKSGTDYSLQSSKSNHYQDIAIRRAVEINGLHFEGDKLIQIRSRSSDPVGKRLSPGFVPFHKPALITDPKPSWYKKKSVESFWQNNKVIQYNPVLARLFKLFPYNPN